MQRLLDIPQIIYLKDYGSYARWMLDTPSESNGIQLHVVTEDIFKGKDLVDVFTEVTGKKSVYKDVTWMSTSTWKFWAIHKVRVAHSAIYDGPTLLTIRQNFSGLFNTWKDNLMTRDYELLDEIWVGRVKSVKEWMEKTGYTVVFEGLSR